MRAARQNDRIILRFAPGDGEVLRRVFNSIIRYYRMKPNDIDPRVADVWYSKRGCQSARMTDEQAREWIENLHGLKGANMTLLQRWARNLRPRPNQIAQLELTDEDSQTLVTVLNDHRLMCAARHSIGEEAMDLRTLTELEKLGPRRRVALLDIMFLGAIIETVLSLLPGNYGDWPAYGPQASEPTG
jgi:hypothetical protein